MAIDIGTVVCPTTLHNLPIPRGVGKLVGRLIYLIGRLGSDKTGH